jgi:hypothetical protein
MWFLDHQEWDDDWYDTPPSEGETPPWKETETHVSVIDLIDAWENGKI